MKEFSLIANKLKTFLFGDQLAKERFFLLLLITLLVAIWFRKGLILGSGESGLPFYNPEKLLELTLHRWSDTPLGDMGLVGFASSTFYLIISSLLKLNIPPFFVQAAIFWSVFVTGVLSIHKLASLVPGNNTLTRLFSSLFYIFNPIVHVAILHRFQYPLILFYGFMPLALLLYYTGLRKRSFSILIFLSLISVAFSSIFVNLALLQMFFLALALLNFLYFFSFIRVKLDPFPLLYLILFGLIFFLFHFWWITPILMSYITSVSGKLAYFDPSSNIETFKAISQNLESVASVFRLFPINFYNSDGSIWGWVYYTPPFMIFSYLFFILFIYSLFRFKKNFLYLYFVILSLLVIFLMKGSLPPFGEFFLSAMYLFSPLQVFRNSFEKIGLLLPLAMSIPIGIGISAIVEFLKQRVKTHKKIIVYIFLIIIFPVYMFPIVNGFVFTGGGKPSDDLNIGQYVKVPSYYQQARDFLNQHSKLSRGMALPMDGEGMTYNWEYGYSGVELSNTLFDQSFISYSTGQTYLEDTVNLVNKTFDEHPENFKFLSKILNIRYLLVRDDIDYQARQTRSPSETLRLIQNYLDDTFTSIQSMGSLRIFEINPPYFLDRVYASNSPILVYNSPNALDSIPFLKKPGSENLLISPPAALENKQEQLAKLIFVNGTTIENIGMNNFNDAISKIPFVRFGIANPLHKLVLLNEKVQEATLPLDKQLVFRGQTLGKRLIELRDATNKDQVLDDYYKQLDLLANDFLRLNIVSLDTAKGLQYHKQLLTGIKNEQPNLTKKIDKIIARIDKFLTDAKYAPIFPTDKSYIKRFDIPKSGNYKVEITRANWDKFYQATDSAEIVLDGKNSSTKVQPDANNSKVYSLGEYHFEKGVHELGMQPPQAINLIKKYSSSQELTFSTKDKEAYLEEIPIVDFDNYATYRLAFDYFIEKGGEPKVYIRQNTDPFEMGKQIPSIQSSLSLNNYDFGWKGYSQYFTIRPNTRELSLNIKILPWGDCKAAVKISYRKYCNDKEFAKSLLKDSQVKIRNFIIERVFDEPIFLKSVESTNGLEKSLPRIDLTQLNSARYLVHISAAKESFFLVLSTAFNTQWKAYFIKNQPKSFFEKISETLPGNPVAENNHVLANGFSNAWYIDKTGDYDMLLEFYPERSYTIDKKVSIFLISVFLLTFIIKFIYDRSRTILN